MFCLTRKTIIPVKNYINSVTKTKYITLLNQKVTSLTEKCFINILYLIYKCFNKFNLFICIKIPLIQIKI